MSFESAPPPPPSSLPEPATLAEEKTWSVWSHAGPLVASVISLPGFIVPLIIMFTKGKTSARVRRNAVESLNFQITLFIAALVLIIPAFVAIGAVENSDWTGAMWLVLLLGAAVVLGVAALVFQIIAIIRASNNEDYRYPVSIRFVK